MSYWRVKWPLNTNPFHFQSIILKIWINTLLHFFYKSERRLKKMAECGCCGDSPLSITGNIIGLLTFAVASIATYIAYVSLTIGATVEIDRFTTDLSHTRDQVLPLLQFCKRASTEIPDFGQHAPFLEPALKLLLDLVQAVSDDLKKLPQFNAASRNPFSLQLRRRLVWLRRRRDFVERMAQVSRMKNELISAQLNILLWYASVKCYLTSTMLT